MTIPAVDSTTLSNLSPNLDVGDVADPALRLAAFQYIYTELQTIVTELNSIPTANLQNLAVASAKLNDLAVITGKIADLAVTTAKINDAAVTLSKMATASVGTSQLVDLSVTTAKIANAAVGVAQLSPGAQVNESVNNALIVDLKADVAQRRINVKSAPYNAKGDGVTDDTIAINQALALHKPLYFPEGTYIYNDKITLDQYNGMDFLGAGSTRTIIQFTSTTITACIERIDKNSANWNMEGIMISGPGKTAGTNIHGIRSYNTGGGAASYNLKFKDVGVQNVSGNGFYICDWFQTYYLGCYARYIKGNGFELGGDQYTTMIDTGSFNLDIDGWSWWFYEGKPFLQNLNCGNVANGLKLGRPTGHPLGVSYCRPAIFGCNIEHCRVGGTGVRFENGSDFSFLTGVNVYSNGTSGIVTYGVYMDYLSATVLLGDSVRFNSVGSGSGFTNKFFLNGISANGGIFIHGPSNSADYNSNGQYALVNLKNNNGALSSDKLIDAANGFFNEGINKIATKTVTASTGIYRDSGTQNDFILLCDATTGNITITLDYTSYIPNRNIIIKKIDATANTVTISPTGNTIDGAATYVLSAQNKYVNVLNNTTKWYVIGNN